MHGESACFSRGAGKGLDTCLQCLLQCLVWLDMTFLSLLAGEDLDSLMLVRHTSS